ncbi:MAG: hypothetical protein WCO26_25685 [Deltaproteobacteria bacterium]
MKIFLIFILPVALVFSSCTVKPQSEGSLVIDMAQKGADIPSSMYGVFFEEINHAGDGGLYAELVQNRSFEEKEFPAGYSAKGNKLYPGPVKNHLSGTVSDASFRWSEEEVPGWSLESKEADKAQMKLTKSNPLHAVTPNSLQISIVKAAGEVALINSGYWGMGVKSGEQYNLRFYLRAPEYNGSVIARLISSAGKMLAEAPVKQNSGSGWNEYKLVLSPDQADAKARLAICFTGAGTV